jgi:mono/diheme cytochrome c family protein
MRNGYLAVAMTAVLCVAWVSQGSAAPAGGKAAQIARGEYLVKQIGKCGDCHTPFNDHGEYVMDKWLQGKKLEFGPLTPMPVWADTSPNIAGLPGWDSAKAVQFFETGLAPNGQPARPPMPAYNMTREDAEAVVAYLKSLK